MPTKNYILINREYQICLMAKRRIAVIGLKGLPSFGGAASVGENLLEQLSDEFEITIYSTSTHTSHKGDYKGGQQIVFASFPIKYLNVFYYYIVSAIHSLIKGKYDLIHLHHMDGAFILLLLRLRYRVLCTSHGLTYKHAKWNKILFPYFKLNEWLQAKLSTHLTVVAKSLVSHYAKIILARKISFIPNGTTIYSSNFQLIEENYILFAAGRIIPTKGLHIFLNALNQINYKGKVVVLGDDTQLDLYSKEIKQLSTTLNVDYKGLIKDKALLNSYISSATLFVFPSTYEAMSMMLLEVASFKTPIICSDIEANTDIFDVNEVLYYSNQNASDLSNKLLWAESHLDEMKCFALRAYAKLLNNFQWKEIAKRYKILYDAIIENRT